VNEAEWKEKLDKVTIELFKPDSYEDPYCCTPTRMDVVNRIREEFGLDAIPTEGKQYLTPPQILRKIFKR